MIDLTEQWVKGKLSDGFYWVKHNSKGIIPVAYSKQHGFIDGNYIYEETDIKQVVEKMPSYDEDIARKECLKMVWHASVKEAKLTALLEECAEWLTYIDRDNGLIAKIDKLLGTGNVR